MFVDIILSQCHSRLDTTFCNFGDLPKKHYQQSDSGSLLLSSDTLSPRLPQKNRRPLVREGKHRANVIVDCLVPLAHPAEHVECATPKAGDRALIVCPRIVLTVEAENCDQPSEILVNFRAVTNRRQY